jgi:hypothetical protein
VRCKILLRDIVEVYHASLVRKHYKNIDNISFLFYFRDSFLHVMSCKVVGSTQELFVPSIILV